jgi:hypothetical protein
MRFLLIQILLLSALGIRAGDTDTIALAKKNIPTYRFDKYDLHQALIVGVPLCIGGLLVDDYKRRFHDLRTDYIPEYKTSVDDYLQYAPAAVMIGLKLSGVKSRSSWNRMLVADVFSTIMMSGVVNGMKYTVRNIRPDNTTKNSFPSGHTATAFMTATMLSNEYGQYSPWVSIGSYTVATFTGFSRMANNRHWLSDVMFGAGIGVISTEMGYFLADVIFKDKGLISSKKHDNTFKFLDNPSFMGLSFGFDIPLSGYNDVANIHVNRVVPGGSASLEGAYFFNPYVGIGGRFSATNIILECNSGNTAIDNTSTMIGPYFSYPLLPHLLLGAKVVGGFSHYSRCTIDGVTYKSDHGLGTSAGISVTYRVNNSYGMSIFSDYVILPGSFATAGEYAHHITVGATASMRF